jgi:hypothetical protein
VNPKLLAGGVKIERLPRCRWCGREPEFQHEATAHDKMCMHCDALQDPILKFGNPMTGVMVAFYVNPDAGLFIEFTGKTGTTDRYTLDADKLRKLGVLQTIPDSMNGRK